MGGALTLPTQKTVIDLKADSGRGALSPSKPTVRQALFEDRENMDSWALDTKPAVPAFAAATVPSQPTQQPAKVRYFCYISAIHCAP